MDLAAHSTVSVLGWGASSSPVTYRGGAMSVESVQLMGHGRMTQKRWTMYV